MIISLINYLVILTNIIFVFKTDNLKHGCSLAALKYCLGEISVIFRITFYIIDINVEVEVEVDIVRFINLRWSYIFYPLHSTYLVFLFYFSGKLSEAETLYKWVLRGFETHYGHSHPETFSVLIKYTDLTYQIYKGNIMKNIKLLEVRTC